MKLDDDAVLEVFRLRLAGSTLKQLASTFGVHWMYVQNVLKGKSRATAHPEHPLRLACVSAELEKREAYRVRRVALHTGILFRAVEDYKRGMTLRECGKKHGVHWVDVGKELKRRGIKARPKVRPRKGDRTYRPRTKVAG